MEEKKYEKFIFWGNGSVGDHAIIIDYANRFFESTKISSLILMKDNSQFLRDMFIPYRDHIEYLDISSVSKINVFNLAIKSIFHNYCYLDIIPNKASVSYKLFAYFIRFFTKSRFVGFNLEGTKNFPVGEGSCHFLGKYNYIPPNLDKEYFHEQANRMLKFLGFDDVVRPPQFDYIKQNDIFEKYDLKEKEYMVFHLCSSHPDRSLPTDRWNKIITNLRAFFPDTKFVFTGGNLDYKFIDEVLANIPSPNNVLAYSLPMQELLTLYANAKLTVTVHTGNAILMNMLHIPLVVLNIRGINIFKRYFSENTTELTSEDGCTCNPFEEECAMVNYKGVDYMACLFNIKDEVVIETVMKRFKEIE